MMTNSSADVLTRGSSYSDALAKSIQGAPCKQLNKVDIVPILGGSAAGYVAAIFMERCAETHNGPRGLG